MTDFDYDNLVGRPSGPYMRIGSKLSKGIRTVRAQIVPYAEAWRAHNSRALAGEEPLWVVLGDSMSQGIGAPNHYKGWVGQLDKMLRSNGRPYRIVNLSISGGRIADVLERQLPAMESLGIQPDLVTVMIGSNDLVRRKHRANALPDFDALIERLPAGAVVANLLGTNNVATAMDVHLQQAARERNLVVADIRSKAPRAWRKLTAEDRFHPNEAGYREIAQIFAQALGLSYTD